MILYKLMRKDEQGNLVAVLDTNGYHTLTTDAHIASTSQWREKLEQQFGGVNLTWERID